jgi:BirA family biotin operon repressor/biotin-[acetyl-CoA-carboxylase] ligase
MRAAAARGAVAARCWHPSAADGTTTVLRVAPPDSVVPPVDHLAWGAEALWRRLEPLLPGLSVEVVARVESTNTELLERARHAAGRRSGDTQPVLLVAEHQTRGRGRLGRDWLASPGASLTFSLALPLAPREWSGLSLAVGSAIADALDPEVDGAAARIGLKWPNDLFLLDSGEARDGASGWGGRKLGGILVETVSVGPRRMAVIGIGLNVETPPATEQGALTHGAAGLKALDPGASAPALLTRIATPLCEALRRFEAHGLPPFRSSWSRRDLLRGRAISIVGPTPLVGVGDGIDDDGALWVRDDRGQRHRLFGGEVSVRPRSPSPPSAPA